MNFKYRLNDTPDTIGIELENYLEQSKQNFF
jgi:hypothetical protein